MDIAVVNKNEEEMLDLIISSKGQNLPAVLDDVIKTFEFTDLKARAWRLVADKADRLEDINKIHASALSSGQQWGIASLYAKARIGAITSKIEKGKRGPKTDSEFSGGRPENKTQTLESAGISPRYVSDAEKIASNPEVVEEVIQKAKDIGEIPTQSRVLNEIRMRNAEESSQKSKIRDKKKEDKKIRKEPRAVADYLDQLKAFKKDLAYAIRKSENDLFSPESGLLIKKKHDEIKELFDTLEENIV